MCVRVRVCGRGWAKGVNKKSCKPVCTRSKREFTSTNGELTKMSTTVSRYVSAIIHVERSTTPKVKNKKKNGKGEKEGRKEAERRRDEMVNSLGDAFARCIRERD